MPKVDTGGPLAPRSRDSIRSGCDGGKEEGMSKPLSFKESLVVWRAMVQGVESRRDEMPHLRELQEALLALVERS
jgi:hypothetical protein